MRKRRMRDQIGPPATIIGPGASLNGAVQGAGHFLVVGRVTGNADIEGALTLAEGGFWKGDIRADDVIGQVIQSIPEDALTHAVSS